ncbi:MAG: TIM barrel protein [Candidatus Omnitrophica bacterium]|nr:xylose isomerase [Candidatus Omnitrophica bacterium COP1]MCK6497390.1 TIM barrel protein [bacterium]MCL4733433.1 TIM barrel protein [Candidatus Omnitrophota bacterium]NUP91805.1 TIM barrel protein [Candidatus Omnitrophota bacterium]
MPRIRQSFCYGLFADEGRSVEQVLRDAADIGLKAVEIWGRQHAPFDEICEKAGEAGLAVSSMCGHESLEDGLNKRENHNRIEDELLASIEIARTRKISGLICFSGNRNAGQSDQEGIEACVEGLNRVKKAAESAGVNLNLELLNSKVDHPGYQCDHTAWGVEVVKQVNSPNVKLLYDIYHMQIMEGDVIRTIRNNIQHIGHFHTAGNPGRNDMDHTQEMDYIGICRAIASTDYPLFVGHEFITHRSSKMQGLKEAFEICDQG